MRILNIDDSTVNNMLMENILSTLGHETLSILEGTGVIEKIREFHPDAVILDIMMPGKSGLDILEEIRHAGIQVPVIVITAMSSQELKRKALELGAADYQSKPVKMKTLQHSLEQVLQA